MGCVTCSKRCQYWNIAENIPTNSWPSIPIRTKGLLPNKVDKVTATNGYISQEFQICNIVNLHWFIDFFFHCSIIIPILDREVVLIQLTPNSCPQCLSISCWWTSLFQTSASGCPPCHIWQQSDGWAGVTPLAARPVPSWPWNSAGVPFLPASLHKWMRFVSAVVTNPILEP